MSLVLEPPPARPAGSTIDAAPLRAALDRLRGQAQAWIWVESLGLIALWAAAFFWTTLLVDWFFEPPAAVRAAWLVAAAIGLGWLVIAKIVARLAAPLSDPQLALLVERTHPQFRDSLSTAIELADASRDDVDEAMLARTVAAAEALVPDVRPARVFRRRSLMLLAGVAAAAAATVVTLAALQPDVAGRWVRRMVLTRNEPWPRRVSLVAEGFVAGVRTVARGSDVEVLVRATATGEIPAVVDLRSRPAAAGGRTWRWDRMGTRGGAGADGQVFGHLLKGVSEPLDLEIRGGDARLRGLRLEVVDAPALESLSITATLPAYLGAGTRAAPPARVVQVPRGADVAITATATKPLSAGGLAVVADGVETTLAELPPAPAGGRSITTRLDGLDGDQTVVVKFTDVHGLVNREPITFVLSAVPDEPPQVSMRLRGISTAVTPRARLPVQGTIADDHGVAEAAVRLRLAEAEPGAAEAAVTDRLQPIAALTPGAAVTELAGEDAEVVPLEPLELVPGRRIEVAVIAADGCALTGGPNRSTSETWSLDVVTPDALLALLEAREVILRRRFESVIGDLTQARERLAAAPDIAETGRLGEAAARAAGETEEIAGTFRDIRLELDNNSLLSPELDMRLVAQIAAPLEGIALRDLPGLANACRRAAEPGNGGAAMPADRLVRQAEEVLARMRAVLDMMMELESFNEVVERLRGVIRAQEQLRSETLERQKKRAREALEGP